MYKRWPKNNAVNAIIFKRLTSSRIQNRERVLQYFDSLSKAHPQNLLNFSFKQYDIERKASNKLYDTSDDSIIFLNIFVQTVLRNDLHKSKDMLTNYMNKIRHKLTLDNINIYYSCLLILVLHLMKYSSEVTIFDLKELVDEFQRFESIKKIELPVTINEHRDKIKVNIIICLMEVLKNNHKGKGLIHNNILQYIKKTINNFNISEETLSIGIRDDEVFYEVAKLMNLKQRDKSNSDVLNNEIRSISLQKYRDSMGFISFDNICNYISDSRFEAFDADNAKKPMYEIFDSLSEDKQKEFIKDYISFNTSRELNLEENCYNLVDSLETERNNSQSQLHGFSKFSNNNTKLFSLWVRKSSEKLKKKINRITLDGEKSEIGTYDLEEKILMKSKIVLNLIPKDVLATLIISNLISHTISAEDGNARVVGLASSISAAIKQVIRKQSKYKYVVENIQGFFNEDFEIQLASTLLKIVIEQCYIPNSLIDINLFQKSIILMEDNDMKEQNYFFTEVNEEYPGFNWSIKPNITNKSFRRIGTIQIHPYFIEEFKHLKSLTVSKSLNFPMLCPPKPWISPENGGYLNDLSPITRSSDTKTTLYYLKKAHNTGQLDPLYYSLNVLGSTSWAINKDTLKILNSVMNEKSGFLKIPPNLQSIHLNKPEAPLLKDYSNELEYKKAQRKFKSELQTAIQNFHNLRSQRIEFNMLQKLANAYGKNGDMIYLPHSIDFRGRAYPMVSLLTHYQSDLVRSLLMFWHGEPLGVDGFNWIKYQLAGVYGMDKLSYYDRIEFVESNIDLILNSARDPLQGKMWWKYGENPWQVLSLCFEINKILEYQRNGGNIEKFICRIPIHQDGSCNGLQHYAALGKDKDGATSVNVIPKFSNDNQPLRGDVYSDVLEIVKSKVHEDLHRKSTTNSSLAKIAFPVLNRKLIKQTVMTTVYGVTAYGGAAQIQERIKELILKSSLFHDVDSDTAELSQFQRKVSIYLSKLVLDSVTELFGGAKLIQDWLSNNCFRIINSFDYSTIQYAKSTQKLKFDFFKPLLFKPMMWTTLSGFPVVQLYKNTRNVSIKTPFQHILLSKPDTFATINTRKQMNAIAPNFIHSIDSLHMLMTCIAADNNSIKFVSVHDSFWTYPKDVKKLSKIIREEFVKMHSAKIIENMYYDMQNTSKQSFQLVWFENKENEELLRRLKLLRNQYTKDLEMSDMNSVLNYEIEIQTGNAKNEIADLIESFQPKLYLRSRKSASLLELYNGENYQLDNTRKLSKTKFTPVLVPIKILDPPPTGDLDISQVMESTYFFS